jgi:DNA (cytosine-5)-methyltransferase 1
MRFLSVCSGIEAASVAWTPLGWKAVAFSEIEPFPCAVLAHHYPTTPNWGDMTKYEEWPDVSIDLLCGGTPCQSFSVAGLRKGLADPRGNLMLTFGAIAAKYRPQWLVWENVPGVLSSNGGRDFGAFLGMLGQLGYGFAYRVLDAQYFGVAQRRRRVFVVGCLGDWRSAAAVLFERHSLCGNTAPSREARQTAPTIPSRSTAGGGLGTDFDCDGGLIEAFGGGQNCQSTTVATALSAHPGGSRLDFQTETFLVQPANTLRGEGFDASEDGTRHATGACRLRHHSDHQRREPQPGDACHPLAAGAHAPAIAFPANLSGTQCASTEELAPSMGATNPTAVAFQSSQSGVRIGDTHATLDANNGPRRHNGVLAGMQVRRLTPTECERLQGFPDGYTAIPWRGKPAGQCPDGPRYKALGNSWAVPNVAWIGRRIDAVHAVAQEKAA